MRTLVCGIVLVVVAGLAGCGGGGGQTPSIISSAPGITANAQQPNAPGDRTTAKPGGDFENPPPPPDYPDESADEMLKPPPPPAY